MSDDLDFSKFRERVEKSRIRPLPTFFDPQAITGTCRWVTKTGQYCFGNKQREDSSELLDFHKYPFASYLRYFPEHLCDHAFCELHSAAAKPHCKNDDTNAGAGTLNKDKQIVLHRTQTKCQYLSIGDDNQMQVTLGDALEEEDDQARDVEFDRENRTVRLNPREEILPHGSKQESKDDKTGLSYTAGSEAEIEITDASANDARDQRNALESSNTKVAGGKSEEKGHSTPRMERAAETRYRDPIHTRDVAQAEEEIVDLLPKPFENKKGIPGYVYVFRDHKIGLVKVGYTNQTITNRLGKIKTTCHVGQPMTILAGDNLEPMLAYLRLEKLIQAYLQPHRWYFRCGCGKEDDTRHQEYFKISDDLARVVFTFWRSFMLQEPYNYGPSLNMYNLREQWMDRIHSRKPVSKKESHEDHDRKLERWKRILRPIGEDASASPVAGDANQETADIETVCTPSSFDKTDRPLSASPDEKYRPDALSAGTPSHGKGSPQSGPNVVAPSRGRNKASLTVLRESPNVSHSVPAKAPRRRLFGDVLVQRPVDSSEEVKAVEARPMHLQEKQDIVRPASSAGGRTTLSGASTQASILFPFTPPPPNRSSNPNEAEEKAAQVEQDGHPTSSTQDRAIQTQSPSQIAKRFDSKYRLKVDRVSKYKELEEVLHRPRKGLPSRTIWEDLVQFRWPLAFAVHLATVSSPISSFSALVIWIIYLLCFVAEMRSWLSVLDREE